MKYIDEYRDSETANKYIDEIRKVAKGNWVIMEICGGQTHTIVKFGIDKLLPENIVFVHGPGCPVCVTSVEIIDKAIKISSMPNVVFCSFGDMLRVPGTEKDLFTVREEGGDVRVVYSPMDALKIAIKSPDKEVVFFGIGFETTAPANAMAIYQAKRMGIKNFSMLVSHFLIPPAMEIILNSEHRKISGFLAPGHVCTVMGYTEYETVAKKYKVPIVVTGFEPLDILQGVLMLVKQLE
ncbi:MAG: hydrogenase formation protein HypD, partial [Brevinematia bacterium]